MTEQRDKEEIMEIVFEYVPEHYVGNYPCATIKIKKSQHTPKIESEINEALENIRRARED